MPDTMVDSGVAGAGMAGVRRRLPDGTRMRTFGVLAGVLLLLVAPPIDAAQSDHAPRRILVLQSMERSSMVFDRFTADFHAALERRVGARIAVFDFVVVPAGFVEAPENAVFEFLQSLYADRRPDLIVTVGGPAAAFTRKHRHHLFPQTPAVLGCLELRWFLRDAPLAENETSVPASVDYTRLVDDIVQLLPETRNVFVVTGSGPMSKFWEVELRQNFERYRNRLTFIWSEDLPYEQVLQRAASLPPHSVVFYMSSGTFASGGWQGDERTLAELSTRANAPVFGVHEVWLGAGIVGGHLLDVEDWGAATADVVVRILNGESPGSIRIPPRSLGRATFDARQLRRWNISEARLPSGSDIRFRDPSLWRDYRREMLAVFGALLLQSLLIVGLLYQRRARRKAEVDSRRNLALAADANRRVTMSALTGSIAHELSQPLNAILHNAQAGEMLVTRGRATPEALRGILSDIRTADVRATQIIDRHRTMLKTHQVDQKPIDVRDVVQESLTLVSRDAKAKQIALDVAVPAEPCIVVGDQVLLQQVLVNLVMNGIEAMADTPPDRRRLTVQCHAIEDTAVVSVRDAGTGLQANVDGQLFESFVTTKTSGLGIGLTIARSIVDAHRGRLEAHNNPDGGATFTLTLPAAGRNQHAELANGS
jgi:signal transduction histidine kinase